MFAEDDLLPISALQHLAFCERQWALIHLEGVWVESRLTAEGRRLHDRVDDGGTEARGDLRIARGLRLRSLRLGLTGRADVVEFHRLTDDETAAIVESGSRTLGVTLPGVSGLWRPLPVEYKRGRPKTDHCDKMQLCAQAMCLEEMLKVSVPSGALFYGKPRRRTDVSLDVSLRQETEALIVRLHDLTRAGRTPQAPYEKKCDNCSLVDLCLPKTTGTRRSARAYLVTALDDIEARSGRN